MEGETEEEIRSIFCSSDGRYTISAETDDPFFCVSLQQTPAEGGIQYDQ